MAYGGNAEQTIEFSVDGENFGTSPLLVPGGMYNVIAMDEFGCTGMMENEVVIGPEGIEVNAASVAESCRFLQNKSLRRPRLLMPVFLEILIYNHLHPPM